ncbi:MAG: hypothetical protein D3924_10890 [Candidatus Electrothrix sp. AR4]|nr:hypothetical protein [Candidatus Electrothrix sp. AR4]
MNFYCDIGHISLLAFLNKRLRSMYQCLTRAPLYYGETLQLFLITHHRQQKDAGIQKILCYTAVRCQDRTQEDLSCFHRSGMNGKYYTVLCYCAKPFKTRD